MPILKAQNITPLTRFSFENLKLLNTECLLFKNRCSSECGDFAFKQRQLGEFQKNAYPIRSGKCECNSPFNCLSYMAKCQPQTFRSSAHEFLPKFSHFLKIEKRLFEDKVKQKNRLKILSKFSKPKIAFLDFINQQKIYPKSSEMLAQKSRKKSCKTIFRSLVWKHPSRPVSRTVLKGDPKYLQKSKTVSSK